MRSHDPRGTLMEAVAHYVREGSPLIVVTELAPYDDALRINAMYPGERKKLERLGAAGRLAVALRLMVDARRLEREARERGES